MLTTNQSRLSSLFWFSTWYIYPYRYSLISIWLYNKLITLYIIPSIFIVFPLHCAFRLPLEKHRGISYESLQNKWLGCYKSYGMSCFIWFGGILPSGKFHLCLSLSLIKFHVFSQSIGFKALGHSIPTIFIFCLSKIFELQKEALCV